MIREDRLYGTFEVSMKMANLRKSSTV